MTPLDRLRDIPGALQEIADSVLDVTVRAAVRDPLPVATAEEAVRRLRDHDVPDSAGPMGMVLGWVSARWATRVLRLGSKVSIPVRAVLMAAPPVVQALRRNAFEMHVLASLVVRRLRAAEADVDARTVRRLVIDAYLHPDRGPDDHPGAPGGTVGDGASTLPRLASLWITRPLRSHDDRAERAARRLGTIELSGRSGSAG